MPNTPTAVYGLNKPAQGDTPWTTVINGDWDSVDSELARPRIPFSAPTIGATTTCDLSLARAFTLTVTQVTTLAFTNVPSNTFWVFVDLLLTNAGAFALSFPASVTWLSGVAPTFPAAGVDRVRMVTRDGGVTWYAAHMGNNLSIARTLRAGYGTATATAKPNQILFLGSGNTGATGESSLVSFVLPANSLAATSDAIRIKVYGNAVTQAAQLRVKFGAAAYVLNIAGGNNITAGNVFEAEIVIRRTAGATELSVGRLIQGAAVLAPERATPAENLTGALTIDVRGNTAVGGGVLNADIVSVEYLGQ